MITTTTMKRLFMYCCFFLILGACGDNDPRDDFQNLIDDTIDDGTDDDSDDDGGSNQGRIMAKINGVQFESVDSDNAVQGLLSLITIEGNQIYAFAIAGADLDGFDPKALGFAFGDVEFDDLVAGKVHQGIADNIGSQFALGTYQETSNGDINATSEDTDNAIVKVTSIDKTNMIISGEFSFTAVDEMTGNTYVVTDGTFTDMQYQTQ